MPASKRDLLPECLDGTLPLEAFQRDWCSRCLNQECTRSIAGKSRFEARVSTWEERLFQNPPRMAPEDPRFSRITAQRFLTIDTGRTPEISSSWVDPRDLEEPPAPVVLTAPAATPVPIEGARPETPAPTLQNDSGSSASPETRVHLTMLNAPSQTGKVLQGAPQTATSKRDPWAVPETPVTTDPIIPTGSRVKLRGSGV